LIFFLENNIVVITATQIFVAPDGDIKFEVGELPITSASESTIDALNNHLSIAACSNHQSEIIGNVNKKSGNVISLLDINTT
jgi:hypothetical protein